MSEGSVGSSESVTKASFYMGTFLWVFYITEAIYFSNIKTTTANIFETT